MTLAVPEPQPTTTDTDSWIPVLADVANLATRIAGTDFVPRGLRDSIPAVAAAILYGREVGLPPMTALTQTHVIEGKPAMSAEAMRAMVLAAGHDLVVEETTGAICTMKARRRGTDHWTSISWTIDMARAAGVSSKNVWKSYPRQMLQARCTTELVRLVFPDVIHGFRSVEELEDMGDVDTAPGLPAPAVSSTKVTRGRKTTTRRALPAPEEPTERPDTPGPPLPGEDGYDALPGQGQVGSGDAEGEAADPDPTEPEGSPGSVAGVEATGGEDSLATASEAVVGPSDSPPEPPEPDAHRGPRPASRPQLRMLEAVLTDLGVDNIREERHAIAAAIVGKPVESFNELLNADAKKLLDTLARVPDKAALMSLLDEIDAQAEQGDS